jgi:hypothetical protein
VRLAAGESASARVGSTCGGACWRTGPCARRCTARRREPASGWTEDASWKHRLTNLRLFLQPFVCACLLLPWLRLPPLAAGLADLCALMNTSHPTFPT